MVAQDRQKLYEFLPSSTAGASGYANSLQLVPRIIDGMQHLADVVISKESPADGSAWQARLHVGNELRTADSEAIADNYLAHLGSSGMQEVRLFELDRPLPQNPSGASNIRLSVTAEPGLQRDQYSYALTMYTPERALAGEQQAEFDEALYAQFMAEGRMGPREAERAVIAAQAERAAGNSGASRIESLPRIPNSGIYSQFAFILQPPRSKRARINTHTFGPLPAKPVLRETPIDSPSRQLDDAYKADAPRLGTWQRMILDNRGGRAVAHFDLSLALRHLAGDKLQYERRP